MRQISALLLLVFLFTPAAMAGFTFVQTRVEVTVKPDDKMVSIPFVFENKTKKALKIARYDSACSCISARVTEPLGKMVYQPGEKGKIVVDFRLGSFSGKQEKTLLLWTTDDPDDKPSSILTSAITIPVLFEIKPSTLFWDLQKDAPSQPVSKTFTIKVHGEHPIRILKHSTTNTNFPHTLKTIRDGWEYEITVTPKNLTSPGMGMIKLTTDSPISRYQRQQAFVCIKRAPAK
jgi:hypothetical protein